MVKEKEKPQAGNPAKIANPGQNSGKYGYYVIGLVVLIDFVFIYFGTRDSSNSFYLVPSLLIPLVGLLTFLGMLIAINLFSPDSNLNKGEIRGAIASSLLIVYFFLIAVTLFAKASPLKNCDQSLVKTSAADTTASADTGEAAASSNEESSQTDGICTIVNNLLDGYTKLMIAVVAFYFGGRSVEEAAKNASGATTAK